jgi:hypothetical protein
MTESLDELMRAVRTLAYSVLASAADALNAGAPSIESRDISSRAAARLLSNAKRTRCSLRRETRRHSRRSNAASMILPS